MAARDNSVNPERVQDAQIANRVTEGMSQSMKRLAIAAAFCGVFCGSALAQERPRTQVVWTKELNSARAMAEREYRLLLVFLFGDTKVEGDLRKQQREIDDIFKQPAIREAAREFVGVRVSCHTFPQEAGRFGISSGPLLVVLSPEGREILRTASTDDGTVGAMLCRVAEEYAPKPVDWKGSLQAALDDARTRRGLVLVAACENDCKACEKALAMMDDRRMTPLKRKLGCLRLEKKANEADIKALDVGTFPHLLLVRPGKDATEGHSVVYRKLWPANPKALAAVIEGELKALERSNQ